MHNLARAALVLLATARATRFFTSDWLGHWTLVHPARRWALHAPASAPDDDVDATWDQSPLTSARERLVKGLDCPFCVGFWLGGVILLGEATLGRGPLRPLWRLGVNMLGLNYLVGHISSRIDG